MEAESLRIGTLARRSGLSVDTIRYYEKRGLLRPAGRSRSRYRLYTEAAVVRLRFIRRARKLGFSLDQIGELLTLRSRGDASCDDARRQAELRLADVELRIQRLERVRTALRELVAACTSREETEDCPMLSALGGREDGSLVGLSDPRPARPDPRMARLRAHGEPWKGTR